MGAFNKNYLAVKITADVTSGKPIAFWSQSISGVGAVNALVAFYDIHEKNRELFFYFVSAPHETNKFWTYPFLIKSVGRSKKATSFD
jgi:lipase chaperone LimK